MAEENDEDLELELADAGLAFRAEMWATNFMMGYWKHVLATLICLLLAFLIFTQYRDHVRKTQRDVSHLISKVESTLESDSNDARCAAASALSQIADQSSGPGKVEALLKAAELYRLCEDAASQRGVLEQAGAQAEGVLKYSAVAALANLDLEEEQGDQAVQRLQSLRDENTGFLAERAAIDLGLALEHLDRHDEAQTVYADFIVAWPDSPRADEVRRRQRPQASSSSASDEPSEEDAG